MRFGPWVLLALLGGFGGCRESEPEARAQDSAPLPEEGEAPAKARAIEQPLLPELEGCDFRHEGLLFDLGTEAGALRRTIGFGAFEPSETLERSGATLLRVTRNRVSYDAWLEQPSAALLVSARIHGGPMRWVTAYLDDERLGSARLEPGKTLVTTFPKPRAAVPAGRHRVMLRFWGGQRKADEPYAELDWLRIGEGTPPADDYLPPTFRDTLVDVALDGQPRRALALRPGASIVCPVFVTEGSELAVDLGLWGARAGLAELRVIEPGRQPVVLESQKLSGGGGATWTLAKLGLQRWSSRLVGLEFRAASATSGGRVAFGEPRLVGSSEAEPAPRGRLAVLVIASGLSRRLLPPWGPATGLSAIAELGRAAATFEHYRAASTLSAAAVASLLTGIEPDQHQVTSQSAKLPERVPLLGEFVKKAGGRAAWFTGVPTTFGAFGFDRGWDSSATISPVRDLAATEPLRLATDWLTQELDGPDVPRLVVAHTRGAHPPWDLTHQEIEGLKPSDYAGPIEPRRAGIALGKIRTQRGRLSEKDWIRIGELERAALRKQDLVLRGLIRTLEEKGVWEDTLFIFMGDVGAGDPPHLPFHPAGELTEDRLRAPLFVKFPRGLMAGRTLKAEATTIDVARTLLEVLAVGADLPGRSLSLAGEAPLGGRPLVAVTGDRYSTLYGPWLLRGRIGEAPRLCKSDVDPSCATDLFDTAGLPAQAGRFYSRKVQARFLAARDLERAAVELDPDTAAALTVWGDLE